MGCLGFIVKVWQMDRWQSNPIVSQPAYVDNTICDRLVFNSMTGATALSTSTYSNQDRTAHVDCKLQRNMFRSK